MQNETIFSILQLAFLAIKKVFAKPLLLIGYITISSALIGIIYIGSDLSGITILLFPYSIFIAILALAYVFSLVVIKNNNDFSQDLSDLWSYILNPAYFLKTVFFVFIRSIKFIIVLMPVVILLIITNPYFMIHLMLARVITDWFSSFVNVVMLCVIFGIVAFYRHIRGMLIVPYGIIGGNNYMYSSSESAKSMKGSKRVFFYILIIYFVIHIFYKAVDNSAPNYGAIYQGMFKPQVPLYENYSLMISIVLYSSFFLIYSTMINLLYFKRRITT